MLDPPHHNPGGGDKQCRCSNTGTCLNKNYLPETQSTRRRAPSVSLRATVTSLEKYSGKGWPPGSSGTRSWSPSLAWCPSHSCWTLSRSRWKQIYFKSALFKRKSLGTVCTGTILISKRNFSYKYSKIKKPTDSVLLRQLKITKKLSPVFVSKTLIARDKKPRGLPFVFTMKY